MGNYAYIQHVLKKRKEYIEKTRGCKIVFIGLFGSQNYGLDSSFSDIDCVAVTMPSLDDLISGVPDVKTLTPGEFTFDESDDGQVKLMDLRDFAKQLSKGSFTNLEALMSDYVIVDKSFADFYNERFKIYMRYIWNYQNSVYGAINNLLKQYNAHTDDGDKTRQQKRMYEMLRLNMLYEQVMDGDTAYPEFYIRDLYTRCLIGSVKCGSLDSDKFLDDVTDIEAPSAEGPKIAENLCGFNVQLLANLTIKDSIAGNLHRNDCAVGSASCAKISYTTA